MSDFPFAPDLTALKKRNEGRPRIVGDIMLYPHRSARRHWGKLSNPLRQLQKIGFLPQEMSIFDYGCGKGVDLHHLSEQGYQKLAGWDPYWRPCSPRRKADIVLLNFVVDCIADPFERDAALLEAWNLTKAYLVVNVRRDNCKKEIPFGDGYLTRWGTFQKGFTQPEFFAWIFKILDEEPFEYDRGGCVLVPKTDKWRYTFRDFDFKKHLPHRGIPRKELAGCLE